MKALVCYMVSFCLCSTVFISFSITLYSQSFGLKLYNINDGLPSTETYSTFQDNYGYLWISTSAGLSRFDGRQFVNYSPTDGLPSLPVSTIFQDSQERLWIGTNTGMAQFINNRFITFPTSDSLNRFFVHGFMETKDKQIYALTGKGVYQFRDSVWQKIIIYPGLENHACRNMLESDGELYVNYDSVVLCRTRKGEWLHMSASQMGISFFFGLIKKDNAIFVGSYSQVFEIRNHWFVSLYKTIDQRFTRFFIDSKKRLWLTKDNYLLISKPGDWQHFPDTIINRYDYVFGITEDRSGNTWLGTREGLLRASNIAFKSLDQNKKISFDGILNIIPLPDSRLILSTTPKTGLLLYSHDICKPIPPSAGNTTYYKDPVDAYTFDDDSTLWMVTRFRKLLRFNGSKLQDFTASLHLKTTEFIYDIDYVKKRKQFFICADSTLLYGDSSLFSTFIPRNTGVPIIRPTRVYQLINGSLLIYIDNQGVYYIDSANNLISLINETAIDGSKKGMMSSILFYEDKRVGFWVEVPGLGLYQYGFTPNKLPLLKNKFLIKDGLQSNRILSITSDWQNRLWVATSTGIDILQKNKAGSWEIFNYAKAEELTLTNCEFEKLVTDPGGTVWLSSPKKVIKFNTAAIELHKETPHIIIEKISLAFKETDWSQLAGSLYSYYQLPYNPVLKYNQNSLGISFNAIDLSTTNSSPEYSYKLLPLDTAWSIPSKIKSVSFSELPAGEYHFIARAKDRASGWSQPAVFPFTIQSPFWDEWWFRIIVIAIASFIVTRIFRARIKKIRHDAAIENQLKELEMKALKAQMNPHFIYNALNSIQALIADNKTKESIRYIGSFSRLLRQVLDHSDNNVISLEKELETIDLYVQLEALRLDMQLSYQSIIPDWVVTEFEKIPPLILQPFVENALWHGLSRKEGKKEVIIAAEIKDSWLVCSITDNGIGRKKAEEGKLASAALHQSKAITITRKRLIDFNDDDSLLPIEFFDLYDDKDKPLGTRVVVHIKRKLS